jgi:CRISPR-associated endonuclease Csn1
MKKVLGLDIGTTSIGWAIVEVKDEKNINEKTGEVPETDINNERTGILKDGVGVRIIAQDTERFDKGQTLNDSKGSTLTPAATRRKYRGTRKMKSRYKLRRSKLLSVLAAAGMKPEGSFIYAIQNKASKGKWVNDDEFHGEMYTKYKRFEFSEDGTKKRIKRHKDIGEELYELRDKALKEPITAFQLGRILIHLNQKRGYSSDRFKKDEKEGNKKGDNEFFTSIVENVSFGGVLSGDNKYHFFIVAFENGDKGCEIRKIQEAQSNFVKGEM